jgi:hypothetical protein
MADLKAKAASEKPAAKKKTKELWIQFSDVDIINSESLQVADDEDEARQLDAYFPGNPWFKFTTIADYADRYFDRGDPKKSKPIYFTS